MATVEAITRTGLDGDGVSSQLFELLWKRDLLSDASLALRIPDTVIYKYNAPSRWYFTSVDGTIKRKSKAKVNSEHIAHEFLKRASPSGIAAYVVTTLPEDEANEGEEGTDGSIGTKTTVEYLDRDGLQDFLFNRQRVKNDGSILQRFVEPKGGCNNMVRALWSPKVCLLERRVNRLKLSDTRYDMYERAVTFEGSDCHSDVTPVRGPALVTKVHEIADSIVQHVAAVSSDRMKISRLALNFKTDDKDRLWLLFASSVRLRDERSTHAPLEVNTTLKVPDHVRRASTTSYHCPVNLQRTCRCPTCDEKVQAECLFDVSYKVIIECAEQEKGSQRPLPVPPWPVESLAALAADSQRSDCEVPEALKKLHPRLTQAEYDRYRHDVMFLYKSAKVCETCYLLFSTPQLGSLGAVGLREGGDIWRAPVPEAEKPLLGVQDRAPNRLRMRRDATLQRLVTKQSEESSWWEEQSREQAREQDVLKQKKRAKSCSKLPSYASPPKPVVMVGAMPRPRPPQGPAPFWEGLRSSSVEPPRPVPARRALAPVRGDPYLREVQLFASKCTDRAGEVLGPSALEAALGLATGSRVRALLAGPSARKEQVSVSAPVASQPSRDPSADADISDALAAIPEDDHHILLAGGADEFSGLQSPAYSEDEFVAEDDEDEDEVSASHPAMVDLLDATVERRSKWPPSCASGEYTRSTTPTTRPPSQGSAPQSGPSSFPCSRPSTRPSSRGKSPAGAAGGQLAQATLQRLRVMRPSSSMSSPQKDEGDRIQLQRPSSSPSRHPSVARPLSLREPGSARPRPLSASCSSPQLHR